MDSSFFSSPAPAEQVPPLNLFQLLSKTFGIFARQFIAFILLTGLVVIPVAVFTPLLLSRSVGQIATQLNALGVDVNALTLGSTDRNANTAFFNQLQDAITNNPQAAARLVNSILAAGIIFLALALLGALLRYVLINSTLTWLVSERVLGRIAPMEQGFGQSSKRWFTLTVSWILFYGAVILLFGIIIFFPVLLAGGNASVGAATACFGLLLLLVLLIGMVFVVFFSLCLSVMLTPVATLEPVGPLAAIGRAWRLGKAHIWTLVLVQVGIAIISLIFSTAILAILNVLGLHTIGNGELIDTTTALITAIVTTITAPLSVISSTLLYYDARVRYDNLNADLAHADRVDVHLSDLPPRHSEEALVSGGDWINMVIMIVLLIVVVILYSVIGRQLGLLPSVPTNFRNTTGFLIIGRSIGL